MSVQVILRAPGMRITIVPSRTKIGEKEYAAWQVRQSIRGLGTAYKKFSDQEQAAKFARDRAKALTGQVAVISPHHLQQFSTALNNLYGTGTSIELATAEFASAKRELRGLDVSLAEVARYYALRHRPGACSKMIAEVVEELIERRKKEGASKKHLHDLDHRLTRFGKEVAYPIGLLNSDIIQAWLNGLGKSPRTLKNFRGAISNLIGFAKMMKYLPESFSELSRLEKIKVRQKPIQIFTPTEMLWMLRCAPDSALPVLILGGFAGLRTSEILLLNWEHIDWQQNGILVPPEGKTQERRVPMEPNLRAWLEPLKSSGRIVPMTENGLVAALVRTITATNKKLEEEKSELRVRWKRNGLRHSYVTYQARLTANPYLVASWTGHSVATMRRFYCNETVTDGSAKAWFALEPGGSASRIWTDRTGTALHQNRTNEAARP